MTERKAPPAAKKAAVTKAAGKAAVKPKGAKTPAVRKTVVSAAAKEAPAQKAVATKAKPAARKTVAKPTSEERYRMVQTAAYFIAERDGFCGCPTEYWAAAELEIASKLG